jgi:hypothetical protein
LAGGVHRGRAVVTRLIGGCGAAVLILLALACGSTSVTETIAPDLARCQVSIGTVPTIPAGGGRVDVRLVTERECAWTASSNSSWIQISPGSGQGEASITLSTTANPQGINRSGNIAVNGSQVAITQAASPCTYSLTPTDLTMPAAGGTTGTRVTTLTGCTWTASSPATWAVIRTTSGSGTATAEIWLDVNQATTARKADLTVAERILTVTQSGAPAPAPAPSPGQTPSPGPTPSPTPPTSCTYSIDPLTRLVSGNGGDKSVKVITGAGCSWTATSNVDWIHIKGDGQGTGTKDLKYEVDRNLSILPRIGTITIAGLTHLVTQEFAR